jgi:hypothetical protein
MEGKKGGAIRGFNLSVSPSLCLSVSPSLYRWDSVSLWLCG